MAGEVSKKDMESLLMQVMMAAKNVRAQRDRLLQLQRRLQAAPDEDKLGDLASDLFKVYYIGLEAGARMLMICLRLAAEKGGEVDKALDYLFRACRIASLAVTVLSRFLDPKDAASLAEFCDARAYISEPRPRRRRRRQAEPSTMMTQQLQATPLKTLSLSGRRSAGAAARPRHGMSTFRCSAAARSYNITLLPGDGIGPGVVAVAKDVLSVAGAKEGVELRFREMLMGGAALDAIGVPLPDETLAAARASDAILLGAIGGYKWDNNEKHLKPETGLLNIRAGLGVFANLRPATVLPQLVDASTLKKEVAEGVDIMVVRELTGGIYFGKPRGFGTNDKGEETGFNTEIYSVSEIDRIARVAFEVARKRGGKLCSVDKANVLEASMLWRKRVTAIASEFPDVELSHMYVDNASMQLVRNPKQFDTIVTNNIFGDILSDEASMITGSIGMLPSASVGESGPGLFEPIHGSAPDIAGQDKANPLATILSAAMLLKYGLGAENAAKRIETAVTETLDNGFRTGDIYSPGTTLVGCKRMGEEVLKALDSQK